MTSTGGINLNLGYSNFDEDLFFEQNAFTVDEGFTWQTEDTEQLGLSGQDSGLEYDIDSYRPAPYRRRFPDLVDLGPILTQTAAEYNAPPDPPRAQPRSAFYAPQAMLGAAMLGLASALPIYNSMYPKVTTDTAQYATEDTGLKADKSVTIASGESNTALRNAPLVPMDFAIDGHVYNWAPDAKSYRPEATMNYQLGAYWAPDTTPLPN